MDHDPDVEATSLHRLSSVTLSHVSRAWRRVALSHSRLWSRVTLDDESRPWTAVRSKSYLNVFLRRSGTHPLVIIVHGGMSYRTGQYLLPLLLAHSARWVSLECSTGFLQQSAFRSSSFPTLERLHVRTGGGQLRSDQLHPAFPDAPNLQDVAVDAMVLIFSLTLPWEQITSFTGPIQHWKDAATVAQLVNVVDLTLHFFVTLDSGVTFPNARKVELTFPLHANRMCHALQSLSFPEMTSLTIKGGWHGTIPAALHHVLEGVVRSSSKMEDIAELSLMDYPLKPSELVNILASLPNLERLAVSFADRRVFDYLHLRGEEKKRVLPRLSHLHVGGDFAKEDLEALVGMLESRLMGSDGDGLVMLKSLVLPTHAWKDIDAEGRASLERLDEVLGLRLTIV